MSTIINFPAATPPLGPLSDTSAAANNAPQSPANPAGTSQAMPQDVMPLPDNTLYSFDSFLEAATSELVDQYAAICKATGCPVDIGWVRAEVLRNTHTELLRANFDRPKCTWFTVPRSLRPIQIAIIILTLYPICNVECSDDGQEPVLGLYMADGNEAGTYQTAERIIEGLIHQYNSTLSQSEMNITVKLLKERAPVRPRCTDAHLIAVNNGIFNYTTKQLLPFTPEKIFLSKSHVNYVPNPVNPFIQTPDGGTWDVETWMAQLSDDPEIVQVLWQIVGAVIRPGVAFDKCIIEYSPTGANGKSTFNALLRALCGKGTCASIPISDFSVRFQLEPIIGCSAIIYDENSTHSYLDDGSAFKACVTHDAIGIDRKNRSRVSYTFTGLMVQGCNSLPKVRDTSGSFLRRLLFVPFDKCFLGRDNPHIKDDYLRRPEVLEYVLHKVLNMPDYYKFDEPAASKRLLAEYEIFNNGVREFFEEFRDQFVWDFLPFDFLYDLYLGWTKRVNPSGKQLSKSSFKQEIRQILKNDPDWMVYTKPDGKDGQVRPGKYVTEHEPLAVEYGLLGWNSFAFDLHHAPAQRSGYANIKPHYTGVMRKTPRAVTAPQTVVAPPND